METAWRDSDSAKLGADGPTAAERTSLALRLPSVVLDKVRRTSQLGQRTTVDGSGPRDAGPAPCLHREDGETQLWLWQFSEDATVSDVTGVQGGTSSLRESAARAGLGARKRAAGGLGTEVGEGSATYIARQLGLLAMDSRAASRRLCWGVWLPSSSSCEGMGK
jgi:hypothetical protein